MSPGPLALALLALLPAPAASGLALLGQAAAFAMLPVLTMAAGATIAAYRPPGERVRSGIQHFAAGVVFSVVAVELLPQIMRLHDDVLEVAGGFALGVAVMLTVEWLTGAHEHADPGAEGGSVLRAMLVAVGADLALDGILVGIAFAAGARTGILLAIALGFELLSLGLALAVELAQAGASRRRRVLAPTALALGTLLGGACLGSLALARAPDAIMAAVLAFGSAALLFLVTEELLVEAHREGETTGGTAMFFLGFLLFLVLGMAA